MIQILLTSDSSVVFFNQLAKGPKCLESNFCNWSQFSSYSTFVVWYHEWLQLWSCFMLGSYPSTFFMSPIQLYQSGMLCIKLTLGINQQDFHCEEGARKVTKDSVQCHRPFNTHKMAIQSQENNSGLRQKGKLLWLSNPYNSTQYHPLNKVCSPLLLFQRTLLFLGGQDMCVDLSNIPACQWKAHHFLLLKYIP